MSGINVLTKPPVDSGVRRIVPLAQQMRQQVDTGQVPFGFDRYPCSCEGRAQDVELDRAVDLLHRRCALQDGVLRVGPAGLHIFRSIEPPQLNCIVRVDTSRASIGHSWGWRAALLARRTYDFRHGKGRHTAIVTTGYERTETATENCRDALNMIRDEHSSDMLSDFGVRSRYSIVGV